VVVPCDVQICTAMVGKVMACPDHLNSAITKSDIARSSSNAKLISKPKHYQHRKKILIQSIEDDGVHCWGMQRCFVG